MSLPPRQSGQRFRLMRTNRPIFSIHRFRLFCKRLSWNFSVSMTGFWPIWRENTVTIPVSASKYGAVTARNVASGKIGSIGEGGDIMAEYPDFVEKCGYGSVTGIGGANCRCTALLLAVHRGRFRAHLY